MQRFLKNAPYTLPQYRVNGICKRSLDMMDYKAASTTLGEKGSTAYASVNITGQYYTYFVGEDSSGNWFNTSQEFDLIGIGAHFDLDTSQGFNYTPLSSQLDLDTSQVSDLTAINTQVDLEELPTM